MNPIHVKRVAHEQQIGEQPPVLRFVKARHDPLVVRKPGAHHISEHRVQLSGTPRRPSVIDRGTIPKPDVVEQVPGATLPVFPSLGGVTPKNVARHPVEGPEK